MFVLNPLIAFFPVSYVVMGWLFARGIILVAAGLADWAALDARLGRCLAAADAPGTPWSDLADDLDALVRAPGADRARLGPRLARVIAARDAVRARYADLFSAPEPESAPAPLRPEAQE